MTLDIAENWKPTSANINALPDPLRRYIRALETRGDSGADIRTIAMLCAQIEELQKLLADERRQSRDRQLSGPRMPQRRFSA